MNGLLWKESYSVGNATLDEQHKILLKLCNLISLCEQDNSPESLKSFHLILNDLADYADTHFRTEEELLIQANYRWVAEHIAEHLAYSEKLTEILYAATVGVIDKSGLARYLEKWWVDHILGSDMNYKSYLLQPVASTP